MATPGGYIPGRQAPLPVAVLTARRRHRPDSMEAEPPRRTPWVRWVKVTKFCVVVVYGFPAVVGKPCNQQTLAELAGG